MDSRVNRVLLIVAALVAGLVFWITPPNDPALPEIVYDREGKPYTQDGERVEEDDPLWEGTRDDNRNN